MLGEGRAFEWQIGESSDWDSLESTDSVFTPEAEPPSAESVSRGAPGRWEHLRGGLQVVLVVAMLSVGVAGYGLWRDYQAGVRRIRTDIQSTVDAEAWAWQNSKGAIAQNLIDGEADSDWAQSLRWSQEWERRWAGEEAQKPVFEVERVELRDDLALVDVLAIKPGRPWLSTPYRETRFYRRIEDRWLRTSPRIEFWGAKRTLDTDYFHLEFYQRDAEAIEAAVDKLDALYVELRRDAGLGTPATNYKLAVEVLPRTDRVTWRFSADELSVTSPILQQVPEGASHADQLIRLVAYPLARRVLGEATDAMQVESYWQPVLDGVRHWFGWEDEPVPSAWHYYIEGLLRDRIAHAPAVELTYLVTPHWRALGRSDWWVRILAAETVVEYAVETYGRDRLPALLQAFENHETWETLIPAVFDVSVEEFEAGWRSHLLKRFSFVLSLQQAQSLP